MSHGQLSAKLALNHGIFTQRTIFIAPLKVGALCCVPLMKRSVSTPNLSLNPDASPAALARRPLGAPVSLVR